MSFEIDSPEFSAYTSSCYWLKQSALLPRFYDTAILINPAKENCIFFIIGTNRPMPELLFCNTPKYADCKTRIASERIIYNDGVPHFLDKSVKLSWRDEFVFLSIFLGTICTPRQYDDFIFKWNTAIHAALPYNICHLPCFSSIVHYLLGY